MADKYDAMAEKVGTWPDKERYALGGCISRVDYSEHAQRAVARILRDSAVLEGWTKFREWVQAEVEREAKTPYYDGDPYVKLSVIEPVLAKLDELGL